MKISPDVVAVRAVEIHGRPPRGAVPVGEVGAEVGQVVPLRPEVVVDHVEDDGQAARWQASTSRFSPSGPP